MSGLNIIGNIQDSVNLISGEKRKFVFNAGSFDAKNEMWTADLLEIIPGPIVFSDWYLPSLDEFQEVVNELYDYSVGDLAEESYWTSTEYNHLTAYFHQITGIGSGVGAKSAECRVRPIRSFTSSSFYTKRQTGPAGGLIFAIVSQGNYGFRYYEAAIEDASVGHSWSNIIDQAINLTTAVIGSGYANTLEIIAQTGHTDSAAKLCNDLSITL